MPASGVNTPLGKGLTPVENTLLASMFFLTCSQSFAATTNETAASVKPKNYVYVPANAETVRWGNVGIGKPVATINSGDIATIETVSHHSGDDVDHIIKGDTGVEEYSNGRNAKKGL